MTTQEEIKQLEIKLASSTGSIEQAELILEILKKYISYNSKDGEFHLIQLIKIADELHHVEYRAWAHYHQGIIHRITENFSASLEETEKALLLFSSLNHEQGMAKAHGNIGNVYWSKGNYAEALPLAQKALTLGGTDPGFAALKPAIEKGIADYTAKIPVAVPAVLKKKK